MMKFIHDLFHTGIPYILVSLFFIIWAVLAFAVLLDIRTELKKQNQPQQLELPLEDDCHE
jgi:hypothetical protein